MKRSICGIIIGICTGVFISATVTGPATLCDSPLVGDHSGAPGETNCGGCHSGIVNPDLPSLQFGAENGLVQYKTDSTYLIHLKIKKAGHNKFGFVCTSLDTNQSAAGTFSLTNTTTTRLFTSGDRKYVSHTPCGADSQDSIAWTYQWKAPSTYSGQVKIYLSLLVSNHDHALTGDTTYTRIMELDGPKQEVGIAQHGMKVIRSSISPTAFYNGFTIFFGQEPPNTRKMISLYDFEGRLILTSSSILPMHYQAVDESLPTGVYFLKVNHSGAQESFKLIKTH